MARLDAGSVVIAVVVWLVWYTNVAKTEIGVAWIWSCNRLSKD